MPSRCGPTLVALATVIGCHHGAKIPDGDLAAALTAPPISGTFDPGSLKGKPSLVMFVTPTCPHCLATIPHGIAAAQTANANLVAVFVAGRAANAAGVVSHTHFPGPALVDDGTLLKRYKIDAVPYVVVLGPDGHATAAYVGEQDESTLADALADAR